MSTVVAFDPLALVPYRATALLDGVNTPDYAEGNYVINPDLSGLTGVLFKYWKAQNVTPYSGKTPNGQVVEMSQAEKDMVDAADLPGCKAAKRDAIDARTQQIIYAGAPFDGRIFSMLLPDQSTWHGLFSAVSAGQMTYPFNVVDIESIPYSVISAEHFYQMYFTGFNYVSGVLNSGRALKDQVNACETIACVNAIVDPR